MKAVKMVLFGLLFLAVSMSGAFAQQPTDSTCNGISVNVTEVSPNTFQYAVVVAPGATISINGGPVLPVFTVDTLYVHPNAGLPTTPPTTITSLNPNFTVIPFTFGSVNNFGYVSGFQNGVAPGQNTTLGSAAFEAAPPNQTFVVRVNAFQGESLNVGFCAAESNIGVVPEPGTLMLLGMGLLPMLSLRRKARM